MSTTGIDLALRNTACVILSDTFESIDFKIITSDKKLFDKEDLLLYNYANIYNLILENDVYGPNDSICIEGLAFNSPSLTRDLIAGNFWYIKTRLYSDFNVLTEVISPASWRAKIFTADEKAELKEYRKENKGYGNMLKEIATRHVPSDLFDEFKNYLTSKKLPAKFIYDLSESYCIATYGVILKNDTK